MLRELWTPAGSSHLGVAPVGGNSETGGRIIAHTVVLKAKDKFGVEHKQRLKVLAELCRRGSDEVHEASPYRGRAQGNRACTERVPQVCEATYSEYE